VKATDKFNPEATCVKCGSISGYITLTYYGIGDKVGIGWWDKKAKEPFIRSHCTRCHYEWDNLPLDSKKKGK